MLVMLAGWADVCPLSTWALGCVHLNERMSSPNFHKGAQWAGRGSAGNVQGTSQRVGLRVVTPDSRPAWNQSHPTSRVGSGGVHARLPCLEVYRVTHAKQKTGDNFASYQ